MLQEIEPSELGTWAAFYRIDPWGENRADLRAAIGHALTANINRDTKQRPKPYAAADFMPYMEREDPELETAKDLQNTLAALGPMKLGDKAAHKRRRREIGKRKS